MSITIPDAIVAAMEGDGYAEVSLWTSATSDSWHATVWYRVMGCTTGHWGGVAASPQAALDALAAKLEARGD